MQSGRRPFCYWRRYQSHCSCRGHIKLEVLLSQVLCNAEQVAGTLNSMGIQRLAFSNRSTSARSCRRAEDFLFVIKW